MGSLEQQAKCYFRALHQSLYLEVLKGGCSISSSSGEIASYTLYTNLTKSAFSQTRYTDSVLASLEPRLFHSKQF